MQHIRNKEDFPMIVYKMPLNRDIVGRFYGLYQWFSNFHGL